MIGNTEVFITLIGKFDFVIDFTKFWFKAFATWRKLIQAYFVEKSLICFVLFSWLVGPHFQSKASPLITWLSGLICDTYKSIINPEKSANCAGSTFLLQIDYCVGVRGSLKWAFSHLKNNILHIFHFLKAEFLSGIFEGIIWIHGNKKRKRKITFTHSKIDSQSLSFDYDIRKIFSENIGRKPNSQLIDTHSKLAQPAQEWYFKVSAKFYFSQ